MILMIFCCDHVLHLNLFIETFRMKINYETETKNSQLYKKLKKLSNFQYFISLSFVFERSCPCIQSLLNYVSTKTLFRSTIKIKTRRKLSKDITFWFGQRPQVTYTRFIFYNSPTTMITRRYVLKKGLSPDTTRHTFDESQCSRRTQSK